MKRGALMSTLCAVLFLLVLPPAASAAPRLLKGTQSASASKKSDSRHWTRYGYNQDAFSVEFPSEPKASPNDGKTGTRYASSIDNDNLGYFVEMAVLPGDLDKTSERLFDDYMGGVTKGTKSELKSQKSISLGGYAGRDFVVENERTIMHFRLYLVEKKLYQVLVVGTKDLFASAEEDRFFGSFAFVK